MSRRWLLAMTIGGQAVLLALGWALTFGVTRAEMASQLHEQILQSNRRTVALLGEQLRDSGGKLEYGSAQWEVAQDLVEGLSLPGGGYACIIDEHGQMLCHPDLRHDPSLRQVRLGDAKLRPPGGRGPAVALKQLGMDERAEGTITFNGVDTHYVATAGLSGRGARLLVHQPVAGLLPAGRAIGQGQMWFPIGAGLVVLLSTALLTGRLVRRHDGHLRSINQGLEEEVASRVKQATGFRDAMIFGLAKLADYRDSDTGEHLERIAAFCVALAEEMRATREEIDDAFIEHLRLASAMHDIGKVGVEDRVLLKEGALSEEERGRIERHPVIGADTLIAIRGRMGRDELVEMSIVVALQHHERWDGGGYPFGLAGEQIALAARIVALADVYDALTSRRVYKPAFTHERAAAIIHAERGKHFDPAVVDAFAACAGRFAAIRASWSGREDGAGGGRGRREQSAYHQPRRA